MARFEVFIPAADDVPAVRLRVEAEGWLAALKAGMAKLGEKGPPVASLLCDVQDDGAIDVTDPRGGRVFRLRELPAGKEAPAKAAPPAAGSAAPIPLVEPIAPDAPVAPEPPPAPIGRRIDPAEARAEEALAALFERVQGLWALGRRDELLERILDLAMEAIPADAGSVLVADLATDHLSFAAARGPKARELLAKRMNVPMGVGLAGFAAKEGVEVAVSDAARDGRFFRAVGEEIGYETRSLLCAPMMLEGRTFGCIEVINKKGSSSFTAGELARLTYLASQAARLLDRTAER